MPDSKVRRVRSEGFSKNSTSCLPGERATEIRRIGLHRGRQVKGGGDLLGREVGDRDQVAIVQLPSRESPCGSKPAEAVLSSSCVLLQLVLLQCR